MNSEIVTLRNPAGHALHCMLHMPPAGKAMRDVACLLLSPGVKMRVAPHRLYRKVTDEFLSRGIPVLRVDFHGLGDSEGELPEDQLDQLYRQVQLGRHVGDTVAAMDALQSRLKVRRFVVGGLCGGAMTALLASEKDKRIEALYAIGIPVTLDGVGASHATDLMTAGQLSAMRGSYLRKVFDPGSWLRLLSFRSDLRMILRSLVPMLRRAVGPAGELSKVADVPQPAIPAAANLNPGFPRAFFRLLARGKPALLIFSGADRLQWEYEEKFAQPWREHLLRSASLVEVETIEKANHVLGDPEWVGRARQITARWLDRRFA